MYWSLSDFSPRPSSHKVGKCYTTIYRDPKFGPVLTEWESRTGLVKLSDTWYRVFARHDSWVSLVEIRDDELELVLTVMEE